MNDDRHLFSSQVLKILKMIREKNLSGEQLKVLIEGGLLDTLLLAVKDKKEIDIGKLRRFFRLDPYVEYAPFDVDYSMSLADMIEQSKFIQVDDSIFSGLFPIIGGQGIVEYEPQVFNFKSNMTSRHIIDHIENFDKGNPWLPARLQHLIAFGADPANLGHLPIIALGSEVVIGESLKCVPCMQQDESGHVLRPHYCHGVCMWRPHFSFLAVRKVVKNS